MAGTTLKLEVITPEKVALRDESTSIIIPGIDGTLGIWPNHAPLLAGLKPGAVTYKSGNGDKVLAVAGGFIEVANNTVTIIAPAAELASDIDVARAQAAKQRAEDRLAKKEVGIDVARAEAALARAIARLKVAGK